MNNGTDLLAILAFPNVENLSATTDALIDNIMSQRDDMAAALLELAGKLEAQPDYARTVSVDRALSQAASSVLWAGRYLRESQNRTLAQNAPALTREFADQ